LTISHFSVSQKYLEKKDGSVESFQDIKEEGTRYYIRKVNQVDYTELNKSELKGYYDEASSTYYHFVAGQFAERVLVGEIMAYTRSETEITETPMGKEFNTTIFLYLDKNGKVFETLQENSAKAFTALNEVFSNDPEVISELSGVKSLKYKTVYDLVEKYNLNNYQHPESYNGSKGKVVFQRKKRGQAKEPVKFSIGDKEYTLDLDGETTIELPTTKAVKVCVGDECELISAIPSFASNVEVGKSKKGKYSIDRK
jgi:hypothetical protein